MASFDSNDAGSLSHMLTAVLTAVSPSFSQMHHNCPQAWPKCITTVLKHGPRLQESRRRVADKEVEGEKGLKETAKGLRSFAHSHAPRLPLERFFFPTRLQPLELACSFDTKDSNTKAVRTTFVQM